MNKEEIEYVESLIDLSNKLPEYTEIMITERQLLLLERYLFDSFSKFGIFASLGGIPRLNGHPIIIIGENYYEEMDFINQSA